MMSSNCNTLLPLAGFLAFPIAAAAQEVVRPALLPRAIASFGAATQGGYLYVYGGHIGRAHQHSRDNIVGSFWRLNLADGQSWEQLPDGPPLQGTALVADPRGGLIRIGGLDARNAKRKKEDLHSVASVARFDPKSNRWRKFPDLPEPRSSHDAFVVGGKLYVVGGWNLRGKELPPVWHATAWVCDVTAKTPTWQPLAAPPFQRRACAVARFGKKVAVLGGIEGRKTTAAVSVFDPVSATWTAAPDLPGQAFGTAAIGVGESLYATVMDGRLFRLAPGAEQWQPVTNLTMPRFFHRLVIAPGARDLIALGGASRGGHMRTIEYVPIHAKADHRMHEWVVPFRGAATYRAALMLEGETLYAFGGNRGASRQRFAKDQFVQESFAFSLTAMAAKRLGDLPAGRQSMAAVSWGHRPMQNLLVGGIGPARDGTTVRTQPATYSFDRRGRILEAASLPQPRTQFQAVVHAKKVWVFGGTNFTPDDRGRGSSSFPLDVLVYDTTAKQPEFVAVSKLDAPRRSFGAAVLNGKAYLIGGLSKGFRPAADCAVFDFHTKEWSKMPAPPVAWVSPQVATIGGRIYVACGGTMRGQRFAQDRSVYSYDAEHGWRKVIDRLPFETRHVQMRALRDRLLFVDMRTQGRVVLRTIRPNGAPQVLQPGFGH